MNIEEEAGREPLTLVVQVLAGRMDFQDDVVVGRKCWDFQDVVVGKKSWYFQDVVVDTKSWDFQDVMVSKKCWAPTNSHYIKDFE